jgi:hypothetical protein
LNKAFGPFGLKEEVMIPTNVLAEHTVFVSSGGKQRLSMLKKSLEVGDDDSDGIVPIGGI